MGLMSIHSKGCQEPALCVSPCTKRMLRYTTSLPCLMSKLCDLLFVCNADNCLQGIWATETMRKYQILPSSLIYATSNSATLRTTLCCLCVSSKNHHALLTCPPCYAPQTVLSCLHHAIVPPMRTRDLCPGPLLSTVSLAILSLHDTINGCPSMC